MKFLKHRNSSLFLGAIAILLLALLATGLDSLEFKQGEPFSYEKAVVESAGSPEIPDMGWLYIIVIGIYILLIFLILYYSPREKRKKIILALFAFALVILAIMWWMTLDRKNPDVSTPTPTALHTSIPMNQEVLPGEEQGEPVVYLQPKISPWISIAISFGVFFLAAIVIWFVISRQFKDNIPLNELAEIAEKTVSDLSSGYDYGDAVINCYASMMEALNRKRSIFKRGDLTPSEFISVLERTKLPSTSVRRLTALFERVRYGGKKTSSLEVDEAVNCLNEIITAIREGQ